MRGYVPSQDLATALHEFVEKDNKNAIQEAVSNVLKVGRLGTWDMRHVYWERTCKLLGGGWRMMLPHEVGPVERGPWGLALSEHCARL
jgi:hypothetical protein